MSGFPSPCHSLPGTITPDPETPSLSMGLDMYSPWDDLCDGSYPEDYLPSPPPSSSASSPVSPCFSPAPSFPSGEFWAVDTVPSNTNDDDSNRNANNDNAASTSTSSSSSFRNPYSPQPPQHIRPYPSPTGDCGEQGLDLGALDASLTGIAGMTLPSYLPHYPTTPAYLVQPTPIAAAPSPTIHHMPSNIPGFPHPVAAMPQHTEFIFQNGPYPMSHPPPLYSASSSPSPSARDGTSTPANKRATSIQCFEHGCGGRRFSSLGNYVRHLREKNGLARRFTCQTCFRSFSRSTAKNKHVKEGRCRIGGGVALGEDEL